MRSAAGFRSVVVTVIVAFLDREVIAKSVITVR